MFDPETLDTIGPLETSDGQRFVLFRAHDAGRYTAHRAVTRVAMEDATHKTYTDWIERWGEPTTERISELADLAYMPVYSRAAGGNIVPRTHKPDAFTGPFETLHDALCAALNLPKGTTYQDAAKHAGISVSQYQRHRRLGALAWQRFAADNGLVVIIDGDGVRMEVAGE